MANNYGQRWQPAGALCCFTAIAPLAAGGSKGTARVEGGNARVAAGLVSRSGARLRLSTRVVAVSPASSGTRKEESEGEGREGAAAEEEASSRKQQPYVVTTQQAGGELHHEVFDHVVLALPRPTATIDLSGLGLPPSPLSKGTTREAASEGGDDCRAPKYQHVHTTLAWGWLDPKYFNVSKSGSKASYLAAVASLNQRSDILVSDGARVPFNSIGRVDLRPQTTRRPSSTDTDDSKDGAGACPADAVPSEISAQHGLDSLPRPRWKLFSEKARPARRSRLARVTPINHAWR